MTLVRILVDGHGLLRQWKGPPPENPHHSEIVREETINWLTRYSDATGIPITVAFDEGTPSADLVSLAPPGSVEVLISRPGEKVGQFIARLARKLHGQGNFLVVGDDFSSPELLQSMGGTVSSCVEFFRVVEATLADLEQQIAHFNEQENHKFTQHG